MPTAPWGKHQQVWPPEGSEEAKAKPANNKLTSEEAYALNAKEQDELLRSLGEKKVPKLEKDKVLKILELQ